MYCWVWSFDFSWLPRVFPWSLVIGDTVPRCYSCVRVALWGFPLLFSVLRGALVMCNWGWCGVLVKVIILVHFMVGIICHPVSQFTWRCLLLLHCCTPIGGKFVVVCAGLPDPQWNVPGIYSRCFLALTWLARSSSFLETGLSPRQGRMKSVWLVITLLTRLSGLHNLCTRWAFYRGSWPDRWGWRDPSSSGCVMRSTWSISLRIVHVYGWGWWELFFRSIP